MLKSVALVFAVTCGALSGCSSLSGGDDDRDTVIEPPSISCPAKPPAPGSECSPLSLYDTWNSCTYSSTRGECEATCKQERRWSTTCGDAATDSASEADAPEEASTDALDDASTDADALEDASTDADAAD